MSSLKKDNQSDVERITPPPGGLVLEEDANAGVKTVEAAEKVYGPHSKWFLFIGWLNNLHLSVLCGLILWGALSHLLNPSCAVDYQLIAVGKPIIAKLADVTSRATAYLTVLIFYVIGYIVIASAQSVGAIAGGIILYAVGYTGLQLLTQVIIADITTLKWRGLVSSLTSAPFIVNAFIGSNISAAVLQHAGWRWGYGMFAILIPASLSPLIVTLFWAENKAKSLGLVKQNASAYDDSGSTKADDSFTRKAWRFAEHLDLIGLILLGAAVALLLLPLTLSQTAQSGWKNPSIIAMLVVGFVLFFVFGAWDFRYAKRPVIALRFVKNRSVLGAAWIGFFDFVSFYLSNTYLWSFVVVVKPWSLVNANYFTSTQTVALTIFGITAGLCMRYVQRYKWILVVGLCVRLLGVGLMIHSRGANASDAEIVWTQILQGMGGGFAAVASQVGAQASVPHADVAIITAIVLLWTEIGGGVGNAMAGAIWTNTMPKNLAKYLPFLSDAERKELFGSITDVIKYPRGDPTREGVISAYDDTMKILILAATCISVIPILLALTMPNWYLGDKQNAVDDSNLAGERVADDHEENPAR